MNKQLLTLAANCGIDARGTDKAGLTLVVLERLNSAPRQFCDQHDVRLEEALSIKFVDGAFKVVK